MVQVLGVAQLVGYHIFHQRVGQLDQVGVQRHSAAARKAAPSARHVAVSPRRRCRQPRQTRCDLYNGAAKNGVGLVRIPAPNLRLGSCRWRNQFGVAQLDVVALRQPQRERAATKEQHGAICVLRWKPNDGSLRRSAAAKQPARVRAQQASHFVDAHVCWRFHEDAAVRLKVECRSRASTRIPAQSHGQARARATFVDQMLRESVSHCSRLCCRRR